MKAPEPVMRPTEDFAAMKKLAIESGLEEGTLKDIVASYGFYDRTELVGCAALKMHKHEFSLECLAVRDRYRFQGLGSRLVLAVEKDARSRGARQIWALARAPDFFKRLGYVPRKKVEEGGPSISSCASCPQYKRNCNPEVLRKEL